MWEDGKDHSRFRLKALSLPLADLIELNLIDQDGAPTPYIALTWKARDLHRDRLTDCVLGVVAVAGCGGGADDHDSESVI